MKASIEDRKAEEQRIKLDKKLEQEKFLNVIARFVGHKMRKSIDDRPTDLFPSVDFTNTI